MAAGGKIVLAGYYGYKNAGDEIILRQILKGLKKYLPEFDVSVLTRPGSSLQGFRYLNRYNPLGILKALLPSRALVMGGGGLLQDKSGRFTIHYYFLLMAAAKIMGKKVIVFNQGVGPIFRPLNKLIAGFIFSISDLLIFRDEFSKELAVRLTGGSKKIFLGADPVFSLRGAVSSSGGNGNSKKVAVVLRKWGGFAVDKIAGELNTSLEKYGYESRFLNFHPRYDRFNLPPADIVNFREGKNIPDALTSCKAIIGMRLHALMLGTIAGLPMVGINYDPKVENFCSHMGVPCVDVGNFSAAHAVHLLQGEIKRKPDYSKKLNQLDRRLAKSWRRLTEVLT